MTNEEVLRAHYAAAEDRADWPKAMEAYDEGVVLLVGEGVWAGSGFAFGKDAVGRWFADWLLAFADVSFEIVEVVPGRDALAMHARHSARGRESGAEVGQDIYYAYWFRAGRIVRVEVHQDRETAWRAAGVAG